MKLIGKNSLSKYLGYFFLILFLVFAIHFIYEIIGFSVCYYKFKTGSSLFDNTFLLSKDVGWAKNHWTKPMNDLLKFRFNYPFSNIQYFTGIFSFATFITSFLNHFFIVIFTFILFKILRELTKENFFNKEIITWMKKLAYLNIAYFPFYTLIWFLVSKKMFIVQPYFALWQFFLGIMILFIIAFFKKGYELQTENDLTI